MPVVAVAGGTNGIGRSIVEEIVADGKFEVLVLSRKVDPELEKALGARILAVDYSDPGSLATLLEKNQVGTVISALSARTPPEQEHGLIQAAATSKTTKRFIPGVWGAKYRPEHSRFPLFAAKLGFFDALEKTDLEWTVVANGLFLDYWGGSNIKTYLTPYTLILDVPGKKAAIPGHQNKPIVFTYSKDIGRFTAKLLTLSKWEPVSYIVGDKLTWQEFAHLAQDVTGEQFEITHDPIELVKEGKFTELPSQAQNYPSIPEEVLQSLMAQFGVLFDEGDFDFQPKQTLNDLFPEIKAMTAREALEIGWRK